jgi:hypothetical protein
LAKRDGISRRYIRRLVGLAFLSPQARATLFQRFEPVERGQHCLAVGDIAGQK